MERELGVGTEYPRGFRKAQYREAQEREPRSVTRVAFWLFIKPEQCHRDGSGRVRKTGATGVPGEASGPESGGYKYSI